MSTLVYETKWHLKTLRGWLIAIVLLLVLFLSFFKSFSSEMSNLQDMIRAFPAEVLRGFNLDAQSFGTFGGYLAYIYTFVQLMLGLLAIISGMTLLGREKLSKSSEFLFSKPVSRKSLWLQKVIVGLMGIILVNGVITLVCFGVTQFVGVDFTQDVWDILLGSLLVQLLFFFLGGVIVSWQKRVKSVVGLASSLSFGFYFLLIIGRLLEEDKLLKLSLYGLFDSGEIQRNGILGENVLIALVITTLLAIASVWRYTRQDLEV